MLNPNPQIVLQYVAFGRWLGHKGGALLNGISAFIKETPDMAHTPSAMWKHSEKTFISEEGDTYRSPSLLVP